MRPKINIDDRWQDNGGQEVRPRRFSVSAESIQPKEHLLFDIVPKSYQEEAVIRKATRDRFAFMLLSSDQHEQVVQAMSKKRIPKHSVIAQQGDYADRFYIVESGVVYGLLDGVMDGQHCAGEGFGDLALLHHERWPKSYVTATDVVLWEVDRVTFRMIMVVQSVHQRQKSRELLSKIPMFSALEQDDRYRIADVLERVEYRDGEVVYCQGKTGDDTIYIIDHGTAMAVSDNKEHARSIITRGDCFGVSLNGFPRQNTVIAQGPLTCLALGKKALFRILGGPVDLET